MDAPSRYRQRNAAKTKTAILDAAIEAFAERGYALAGIRDIAAAAGISSTMLLRYYGSKSALFEAALVESVASYDALFAADRERFGEHLARLLLDAELHFKQPSMVALSAGDPEARDIAARVMEERVVKVLAKWLGAPDARGRALQIIMLSMGFLVFTRQVPLMPVGRIDKRQSKWFAQAVQAVVNQH